MLNKEYMQMKTLNMAMGIVLALALSAQAYTNVIDGDGVAAGFSHSGFTFTPESDSLYNDNMGYAAVNSGNTATWAFTGLASNGHHTVYASWSANANRSQIADYAFGSVTSTVNQEVAPANDLQLTDGLSELVWLQELGSLIVTDNTVTVTLSDNDTTAAQFLISDAVAVVKTDQPDPLVVDNGDAGYTDNMQGDLSGNAGDHYNEDSRYAASSGGWSATWDMDVENSRYTVYASWKEEGNRSDAVEYTISDGGGTWSVNQKVEENHDLQITDDLAHDIWFQALGVVEVSDWNLSVTVSDDDGSGYLISDAVAIKPTPQPDPWALDDGNMGFTSTAGWTSSPGATPRPFNNDYRYALSGGSTTGTWTFAALDSGLYKVYATWLANANRSDNVDYGISDGGGTYVINQDNAPSQDLQIQDVDGSNVWFETLGLVTVSDGSLSVTISDDDGVITDYMVADSVAIQRHIVKGTIVILR